MTPICCCPQGLPEPLPLHPNKPTSCKTRKSRQTPPTHSKHQPPAFPPTPLHTTSIPSLAAAEKPAVEGSLCLARQSPSPRAGSLAGLSPGAGSGGSLQTERPGTPPGQPWMLGHTLTLQSTKVRAVCRMPRASSCRPGIALGREHLPCTKIQQNRSFFGTYQKIQHENPPEISFQLSSAQGRLCLP